MKPTLKAVFPEVHTGVADLLVYFYGRALQIMRTSPSMSAAGAHKPPLLLQMKSRSRFATLPRTLVSARRRCIFGYSESRFLTSA